jgi:O-antigen/teichoic acid export membrane protein
VLNYLLVRGMLAVTATLLVFPEETIRLLLGSEWLAAAPVLRWLAFYAALLPLFEGLKVLLLGRGAVRLTTLVRCAQLAVFVPGIALASAAGRIEWVGAALLAATAVGVELERRFNREYLAAGLLDLLAAPCALVAAVWLLFEWVPLDLRAELPFWLLPPLPAALYAVLLAAFEQRRLRGHFAYLQGVLRRG